MLSDEFQVSERLKNISTALKHTARTEDSAKNYFKHEHHDQLQHDHKSNCIYNYDIIVSELSDELSVDHLLSDDGRSYIRPNLNKNIVKFLKNGKWKIEAKLDLHNLCIAGARSAFINFMKHCIKNGVRCVSIIHGKGYGSSPENGPILKNKVRSWLVQTAEIRAFSEALEHNGGSGALVVLLHKTKNES
ncbi:Smr domain protein [Candidatus Kinetoplastibacterium blastocrithidii TCC012E]|uniref:Smr domain protein n=2 Tax=Candidatus Kinetoplastidibacterium blastocrithidiae TaxID=233181 RepID=M1LBW9_9PROT|nr:Smr domain protein [Candidatus Kinetoplastibacterium blastocrithidii TCC012E]